MNIKIIIVLILFVFEFVRTMMSIQANIDVDISELTIYSKSIIDRCFSKSLYLLAISIEGFPKHEIVSEIFHHILQQNPVPVISLKDCSHDKDFFTALTRNDNMENSVGFIFISEQTRGECFVNSNWTYSPFWNPRAVFLLVVTTTVTEETGKMADMFRDCWENFNILNLVVIFQYGVSLDTNHSNSSLKDIVYVRVLTFNPFLPKGNVINIYPDQLINSPLILKNKLSDTYGYIIPTTKRSTPPYISEKNDSKGNLHLEGPDMDVFNILMKMLNASNIYKPSNENDNEFNPNNYVLLNIEPVQPYNINRTTYPHLDICITAITPKASEIPRYMNIILPFNKNVWLLYLFTTVCLAIIWKIISMNDKFEGNVEFLKDKIIDTLSALIIGSAQSQPSFFPQRLMLLVCLFLNILMNNSYQGNLTSYLSTTKYLPDFKTINELVFSDLKISCYLSVNELQTVASTMDMEDELLKTFIPKLVLIQNEEEAIFIVAHHKNISRITYKTFGLSIVNQLKYYKDESPLLHLIDDCFASLYGGIDCGDRNSPFIAVFSKTIQILLEGGFIAKWNNDFIIRSFFSSAITKSWVGPKVFSLDHLIAPFYILGFGLCLGTVIFMVEIIMVKFAKRKHRKKQVFFSTVSYRDQ